MTVGLESCNEAVGVLHVTHSFSFFGPFPFLHHLLLHGWVADLGLLVLSITWAGAAPHGRPQSIFYDFCRLT